MRTHKHALISVGYAGSVALIAGHGAFDPYVYIFALIGGELIDFIDHPLYHLFYQRKESHVVHARKLFLKEGVCKAIRYLNRVEEKREFKGLILHNAFSLLIVSSIGIVSSVFLSAPVYLFIFLGAFLLHMIMDVLGDFWILGHADNWIWVVPQNWVRALGAKALESRIASRVCLYILPWLWWVVVSFIFISARAGLQLSNPAAHGGLYREAKRASLLWIPGSGLLILIFYALGLLLVCIITVRKYSLEVGNRVPFSHGSISMLFSYLTGRIARTRSNAERLYLRVEADAAVWSTVSTSLIAFVLLSMTWLHWKSELLFFLTPIFFALLFGTLIHSTVGELAGGFGVILAWTSNIFLARFHLQEFWPLRRGFLLFLAAVVAWAVGLLGAVFLRGVTRMSIVAFVFEFSLSNDKSRKDGTPLTISLLGKALQKGYREAHELLLGNPLEQNFLRVVPPSLLVEPYGNYPIWGVSPLHLEASDSYSPLIRETGYTICENGLMAYGESRIGLLPVMPRHRIEDDTKADLHSSQTRDQHFKGHFWRKLHWQSRRKPLTLTGPAFMGTSSDGFPGDYLRKTWAEFIDNFVTRQSTFKTDIFLYPPLQLTDPLTACGVVRERTSTKEYATIEAEVYAGSVMNEIIALSGELQVPIVSCRAVRLVYPRVSIFDETTMNEAQVTATLPSSHSTVPASQLDIIKECVDKISPKKALPYATADFGKKLMVLAFELGFTTVVVALGFNPAFVKNLLHSFIDALR